MSRKSSLATMMAGGTRECSRLHEIVMPYLAAWRYHTAFDVHMQNLGLEANPYSRLHMHCTF